MYYADQKNNSIIIREAASGAYHFEVFIREGFTGFSLNGNVLSISYKDGADVYDVHSRSHIR